MFYFLSFIVFNFLECVDDTTYLNFCFFSTEINCFLFYWKLICFSQYILIRFPFLYSTTSNLDVPPFWISWDKNKIYYPFIYHTISYHTIPCYMTNTSELDKTNNQKEKRPREDTKTRDSLTHPLRNPIKTPNWNSWDIYKRLVG